MKYARACVDCKNWFLADRYQDTRCPYCVQVHRRDHAAVHQRELRQARKAKFAREYAASVKAKS